MVTAMIERLIKFLVVAAMVMAGSVGAFVAVMAFRTDHFIPGFILLSGVLLLAAVLISEISEE